MPQDHEDGTVPTVIMRADMTLCVDVTAQTIGNINIDIAAQSVGAIDINIAAQSVGSIDVNIAAAAVTLNVNISSQSANINVNLAASAATVTVSVTGTANVDIEAQSVGVYLKPDWETKEGNHKVIIVEAFDKAYGVTAYTDYAVTAGKTLYIVWLSGAGLAANAADADAMQIVYGKILYVATGDTITFIGGNGGFYAQFPVPLKIAGGTAIRLAVTSYANHDSHIYAILGGYEI
jgi:hypothetical protein